MNEKFSFETWPRDPKSYQGKSFLCMATKPMPKDACKIGTWRHSNTHEIGEQEDGWPGGDIVTIECEDCGHRWKMELPQ